MDTTLSLLFIEDDAVDQLGFRFLVEREHLTYDYRIAESVATARSILGSQHFDVVIADYALSDGTVFDLLPLASDTPVIIVTGAGNEAVAVAAMQAGACDYLTKDSQQQYLTRLPVIVQKAVYRRNQERQALHQWREQIRQETVQQLIQSASHDLRTPLTTCGTSLYLLTKYVQHLVTLASASPLNPRFLLEAAHKIEERCNLLVEHKLHLEQIILNMLEIVRVDNLTRLDLEVVALNPLMQDAVKKYAPQAARKAQSLTLIAGEPVLLKGSPPELALAIQQVLQNAISFTPEQGHITVSCALQGDEIILAVIDTGRGIAPEDLPRIFDHYYRGDKARSPLNAGSGLGLAIVKRLVELHQGRIEVESTLLQGTTVRLILPALTS